MILVTGETIPIAKRIGLLDRKLRVVSENTETEEVWLGYFWQKFKMKLRRAIFLAFG